MAVDDGYISVTPLRLDTTNNRALDWLKERIDNGGRPGHGR